MAISSETESVVCPWCKERFDIEPLSTAGCFECPACKELCTLGSLRNPDHRPNSLDIHREAATASAANLYRHTVPYVFLNKDGYEDSASGTLVQLGEYFLLATVRHSIPANLADVHFVKKSDMLTVARWTGVRRRFTNETADVAVFELDPEMVARIGLAPITIDRIHDAKTGTGNMVAKLIGYPLHPRSRVGLLKPPSRSPHVPRLSSK